MRHRIGVIALIIMGGLAAVAVTVGAAHATPGGCQRALIKESRHLTDKVLLVRQRCEDVKVLSVPSMDCSETGFFISRKVDILKAKFRRHVESACADETLASVGWGISACPDFESSGCSNAIAAISGVVDCILCVNNAAQSNLLTLYYGALNLPTDDHALRTCQRTIGSRATSFYAARIDALATCERKVLSGALPGPCPDLRTQEKIDELERQMESVICRKCGGADRMCGGADDRTPTEIGFTSACLNVTIPGGAACGGAIASLGDLVACVDCVTEFTVDCFSALPVPNPDPLAFPGLRPYPPECN